MSKIKKGLLGIYSRISQDKSNKADYSLETQENAGILFAKEHGLEYKIYSDQGVSGTVIDRPSFGELFEDIKTKKISCIYAYDQSRLERDIEIWQAIISDSIKYNVDIYLGGVKFDYNDPSAAFQANIISASNYFYAQITSTKVREANKLKFLNRKTHGKKAYGLGRDENNNYIELTEESTVVKEIFNLALKGNGAYTIASILNNRKVPTKEGGIWQQSTINGMLSNKIYIGINTLNRTKSRKDQTKLEPLFVEIPIKIIDQDVFEKVQEIRSSRKNVGTKSKYNYLLNDLIFCPACGSEITGRYRPSSRDNSYKCKNFHKHYFEKSCSEAFGVSISNLETFIIKLLFESKQLNLTVLNSIENQFELDVLILQKNKIESLIQIEERKQDKLLAFIDGDQEITQKEIDKRKKINNNIKSLKFQLEEIEKNIYNTENQYHLERTKNIFSSYFKNIDFNKLRALVLDLIEEIILALNHETNEVVIKIKLQNFSFPLLFIANRRLTSFNLLRLKDEEERKIFDANLVQLLGEEIKIRNTRKLLSTAGIDLNDDEIKEILTNKEYLESEAYDIIFVAQEMEIDYDFVTNDFYEQLSFDLTKKDIIRFN